MTRKAVLLALVPAMFLACGNTKDRGADRNAPPVRAAMPATTSCGTPGNDCPLQAWMKSNASPPMIMSDFPRVEHAFDRIATLEPSGDYPRWREISHAGGRAARANDIQEARRSCKQCHDAYRERYRVEHRTDALR